jgi:hypothetical protein
MLSISSSHQQAGFLKKLRVCFTDIFDCVAVKNIVPFPIGLDIFFRGKPLRAQGR